MSHIFFTFLAKVEQFTPIRKGQEHDLNVDEDCRSTEEVAAHTHSHTGITVRIPRSMPSRT
jgi:hypothetical protein